MRFAGEYLNGWTRTGHSRLQKHTAVPATWPEKKMELKRVCAARSKTKIRCVFVLVRFRDTCLALSLPPSLFEAAQPTSVCVRALLCFSPLGKWFLKNSQWKGNEFFRGKWRGNVTACPTLCCTLQPSGSLSPTLRSNCSSTQTRHSCTPGCIFTSRILTHVRAFGNFDIPYLGVLLIILHFCNRLPVEFVRLGPFPLPSRPEQHWSSLGNTARRLNAESRKS